RTPRAGEFVWPRCRAVTRTTSPRRSRFACVAAVATWLGAVKWLCAALRDAALSADGISRRPGDYQRHDGCRRGPEFVRAVYRGVSRHVRAIPWVATRPARQHFNRFRHADTVLTSFTS